MSPIHMVCDYSNRKLVDIVTAYIPQRLWWISPVRRGKAYEKIDISKELNAAADLNGNISLRNMSVR